MFVKPIDRDIQGVIIVGQGEETNVAQELEEYVVTKELQKHFATFFSNYKQGIIGHKVHHTEHIKLGTSVGVCDLPQCRL